MPILDVKRIFEALKREEVQFLLVGGLAGVGHGMNYLTDDLDICYERKAENIRALVKALTPSRPRLRVPGGEVPFLFDEKTFKNTINLTLATDWGSVDLLGHLEKLGGYEDLIKSAVRFEFYGIAVDTISLDGLITAKKIAGRPKDLAHLKELEAIREMRKKS